MSPGAAIVRIPHLFGRLVAPVEAHSGPVTSLIRLLSVMRPSRPRAVWVGAARSAHPAGGVEDVGVLIAATVHLHLEQRLAQCLLAQLEHIAT